MADDVASRDVNRVTTMLARDDTAGEVDALETDPTTKRLKVDAVSESEGHTAVGSGTLYIINGGSVQQLSSQSCKRAWVQVSAGSTGPLLIGGSSVAATATLRQGLALYPTQGAWFEISNLNLLYITSGTKGDAIHFYYEN